MEVTIKKYELKKEMSLADHCPHIHRIEQRLSRSLFMFDDYLSHLVRVSFGGFQIHAHGSIINCDR
jgi:hypothetical protein